MKSLVLSFAVLCAGSLPAAPLVSHTALQSFPVADVRLLPGSEFAAALAANKTYLLALDPDRLLAPFRREAGLPKKAESYGNWENIGLDGHTAGHYLSALSTMVVATGDAELSRRLTYMVAELADCQQASADGYVGGIPGSAQLWAE
ncbi:MAG: beta-L-arabinofuranosidase domain-containing protein, partial [Rariglobus sp.]